MDENLKYVDQAKQVLDGVIGKNVTSAYVHLVEPEINQVVLCLEKDVAVAIYPGSGGEVIGVASITSESIKELVNNTNVVSWDEIDDLYSKRILGYRFIGEPWNGHGLEIDFEFDSVVIEVVEGVPAPYSFFDCLRIGITHYIYKYEVENANQFQGESCIGFLVVNKEVWVPETIFIRLMCLLSAYQLHYGQILDPYQEIELNWQQIESFLSDLDFVEDMTKDNLLKKYIREIRALGKYCIYNRVSMSILGN